MVTGGRSLVIQVSTLLEQELPRPKDMLFRYGGEEFTCLLPNTTANGVEEVATKLLKAARNSEITISIGAICVQFSKLIFPLQLLEIADRAMYQAKNQGRGRLVLVSI